MIANGNNKASLPYEPHLTLREFSVPAGREWTCGLNGWSLIQVGEGAGYWLHEQFRSELAPGALLLVSPEVNGRILASQLGFMTLHVFNLVPERLTGLMTLGEQNLFKKTAARLNHGFRLLPAHDSLSVKMNDLRSATKQRGLLRKLGLLQLVVEVLGDEIGEVGVSAEISDARERLRKFLQELPPNALLEISFDELAQMNNCTPRHLSRIFYDVVGMSFRDKRAEVRLARARELLATSQTKVVEVALESGYKSLSFFNLMFTRRFGISPGRWRQKHGAPADSVALRRSKGLKPVIGKTSRLLP
jgi:AraC-like DNA-binding protein